MCVCVWKTWSQWRASGSDTGRRWQRLTRPNRHTAEGSATNTTSAQASRTGGLWSTLGVFGCSCWFLVLRRSRLLACATQWPLVPRSLSQCCPTPFLFAERDPCLCCAHKWFRCSWVGARSGRAGGGHLGQHTLAFVILRAHFHESRESFCVQHRGSAPAALNEWDCAALSTCAAPSFTDVPYIFCPAALMDALAQ